MRTVILLGFVFLSAVITDASNNPVNITDSLATTIAIAFVISIGMDILEFIKNMTR